MPLSRLDQNGVGRLGGDEAKVVGEKVLNVRFDA